jgi:acyl transferase domain-containing protein
MGTGRSNRHARGIAGTPAVTPSSPAFVFGPQIEGDACPELAALIRRDAGDALDEWCACIDDPVLAEGIARFLDSGDIERLWLQSAVTALQIALATALRRRGLEPAEVAGLHMGELAAAVVAGQLDVRDATRVARGVSVLFAASAGAGRLVAVAADRACLACVLDPNGPRLAATLAPRMQLIAGSRDDVDRLTIILRVAGVEVRGLRLPSAFHSTVVEALRDSFLRQLGSIASRPGHVRLYSGIDPGTPGLDAQHWWNVCRRPFHFDDAIRAMLADGVRWFVEIGPRSAVAGYILAIADDLRVPVRVDSAQELLLIEPRRSVLRGTGT